MPDEQYNGPVADTSLIGCPHCDLLQRLPDLAWAASVRCPRCDHELWRRRDDSLNRTTALAVAATILYIVANTVPMLGLTILGLTILGREASTTVIQGAQHLWQYGQSTVAALVLFTAVIAPALQIILMLTIVLGARRNLAPRWVGTLLSHQGSAQTWRMLEVMMLGVLVALVKIADYATVIPGTALFVLGALIVVLTAMQASFEPRDVWHKIRWVRPPGTAGSVDEAITEVAPLRGGAATAMQQGLQGCETCGLLSRPAHGEKEGRCPRCGKNLEFRKRNSIQRAWAFVIAAAICYVPANVFPVLTTTTAAGAESDTILQGVVLLWSPTGWPLSLIVLVASTMMPSAKILALGYLLITVQRGTLQNNEQRRRLYRTVDFIGRWSMSSSILSLLPWCSYSR